jgi:hypothetical protein
LSKKAAWIKYLFDCFFYKYLWNKIRNNRGF